MNHIYQRTTHDCGVAAIAMFCDMTYDEALELCLRPDSDNEDAQPIYREGWGMNRECIAFRYLGLWDYGNQHNNKIRSFNKPPAIDATYFRNIAWGRRALIMVPSLNIEGGFHFICYDGEKVLDPNDPASGKKIYTKFEELAPVEIWVWNETRKD
jgi:hypothetical protein